MKHAILVVALILIAFTLPPPTVEAAIVCPPNAMRQDDIAGIYVSDLLMVEIYGCGGSIVHWSNRFGRHAAVYVGYDRLMGHGVLALSYNPDPLSGGFLDNGSAIGFKAAEPGYLDVATYARPHDGYYGGEDIINIYRVQKMR